MRSILALALVAATASAVQAAASVYPELNVADGTNEILNRSIVQRLLKGDTEL